MLKTLKAALLAALIVILPGATAVSAGTWTNTIERQQVYKPTASETGEGIVQTILAHYNIRKAPSVIHANDEFVLLAAMNESKERFVIVIEYESTQSDHISRVVVHKLPDATIPTSHADL